MRREPQPSWLARRRGTPRIVPKGAISPLQKRSALRPERPRYESPGRSPGLKCDDHCLALKGRACSRLPASRDIQPLNPPIESLNIDP